MANRMILPAALRYQGEVAASLAQVKAAGARVPASQTALLDELTTTIEALQSGIAALSKCSDEHVKGDTLAHARHSHDALIPAMNAVRVAGDKLEGIVASDLWPLPTYQEMLFIK
jgi:glutamine synthetase